MCPRRPLLAWRCRCTRWMEGTSWCEDALDIGGGIAGVPVMISDV